MKGFRIFLFLTMMITCYECVTKDCPIGQKTDRVDSVCPDGTYWIFNDFTQSVCCEDKTPCVNTGMVSHFPYRFKHVKILYRRHSGENGYLGEPPNIWFAHEYKTNGREWLCPVPVGYLWKNIYKMEANLYDPKYLPVDFKGIEDFDHVVKTCNKNGDCGDQEFCGDVINASYEESVDGTCSDGKICDLDPYCSDGKCHHDHDRQTWADKVHMFCYKIPPIPAADATKMQYAMHSSASNLVFCNQDSDCDIQNNKGEYCHTTLERNGQKWTSYEPDPDPTKIGLRKHFDGLCMDAKPFASLLRDLFNRLSDQDKIGIAAQKFLPVDMKHGDFLYLEKLKKCEKNSQCGEMSFCGESVTLLESNNYVSKHRKYCYEASKILKSNVRPVIHPEEVSLMPCDTNVDCIAGICHIDGTSTFSETGNSHSFKGLCIEKDVEEESSVIWIIVIISLILIIVIAVAVFLVLRKLKKNKTLSSKALEKTDKSIVSPTTPGTTSPVSKTPA